MAMVDIMAVVNAALLARQVQDGRLAAGSPSAPTPLGGAAQAAKYIATLSASSHVASTQGDATLAVMAASGDTLRWTMVSLGNDLDYTPFLCAGSFKPASGISPLAFLNLSTCEYLPSGTDPLGVLGSYTGNVYVAQATLLEPGITFECTLTFQVVDNGTGTVIGCFCWNTVVKVAS